MSRASISAYSLVTELIRPLILAKSTGRLEIATTHTKPACAGSQESAQADLVCVGAV